MFSLPPYLLPAQFFMHCAVLALSFDRTISITTNEEDVSAIRVEAIIVQFVVVAVDFYYTAPQFKSNHVLLAMLWPSTWLFVQLLWVVGGHQPSNNLFNFHTRAAPLSALSFFVGTAASFYFLQWVSKILQRHHEKRAAAVPDDEEEVESMIASPNHENIRMTQFELMIESSGNRFMRQMSSSSSNNINRMDIVPDQVQLHPDTTTTIHIPPSRHQGAFPNQV